MSTDEPIQSFVAQFRREYDFYYEVARLVAQRCEELSAANGIRAIVTFRAKRPDRLEEKLRRRNKEKNYQSTEDIRSDIVDLSGVRIALYFPGDRTKISALLRKTFLADPVKEFRGRPKTNRDQRFDGYYADHYRVRLEPSTLTESQRRYSDSPVEIQVASVLMHAWSEVEHDLVYKPLSGEVSQDELNILDGLNGIVLSGEVFLERLQAAFEARVSLAGSIFSNQYELAAFLYDRLRASLPISGEAEPVMGRIDNLFRLLQAAELNRPDRLLPYLEGLNAETERGPLAEQVVDRILEVRSDLNEQYIEIRKTASSRAWGSGLGGISPSPDDVGSFLQKWTVLERFSRALARSEGRNNKRLFSSMSGLLRYLEVPERLRSQIATLQRLRNNLVHGISIPEDNLLSSADQELAEVLEELGKSDNPGIREAMRWARSNEPEPG